MTEEVTVERRAAQRFLAGAARLVANAPGYEETLRGLVRLAVPTLADWCRLDVLEPDGALRPLALACDDPRREAALWEIECRYPLDPDAPVGAARVVRYGSAELTPRLSDADLAGLARDAEHLAVLRALGLRSSLCVPLVAHGRVLGALTLLTGVSGRQYEAVDLAAAEDIACLVAVALENERLRRKAEAALRAREIFVAAALHDLATPLAVLRLSAEALAERAYGRAGRELVIEASRIDAQVERLFRLRATLGDLARLETGEPLPLDRRTTDLAGLARQVTQQMQRGASRHGVQIDAEETPLVGQWDAGRLERVIENLLSNAFKYTPAGGTVVLSVARDETADPGWAILRVRDRGVGIPAADLTHVFEPFYRAGNVAAIPGAGIGLAGVRQIVEAHGGTIAVESEEGVGSTFTVRLPLRSLEESASRGHPTSPAA